PVPPGSPRRFRCRDRTLPRPPTTITLKRRNQYEKDSPRAGQADLIVAKHRHGPTATITVAFQGHYSRFVDMAQT
ncbi:DnaB-like helicase C-terminal domain-containing protein, partial [Streptomyces sp. NPDC088560]|uniref:DnaB-like helicase C-terminal domain-containing protein n=1 Tax=Streptomyces sp. NPDC088560 TaxID=3365868 RepID=UPI00380BF1C3